jgi:hypothetical protein
MRKTLTVQVLSLVLLASGCAFRPGAKSPADSNSAAKANVSAVEGQPARARQGQSAPITIAWDPPLVSADFPSAATGYVVNYGYASRQYEIFIDVGNVTQWAIQPTDPRQHFIAVNAYNPSESSSMSNEIVVDTGLPIPTQDTTPPSAPGQLLANGITQTGLTLAWGAATDNVGVAYYRLYKNGNLAIETSTLTAAISDLTCAVSYTFGLEAFDAAHNGSPVITTIATTLPCGDPAPPPPPPAPDPVVDTTPPTVSVTSVVRSGRSANFTITIQAEDASGIQRIDVFVDDKMAALLTAPTAVGGSTYQAKALIRDAGPHTLRVVAYDLRANQATVARSVLR